MAIWEDGRLFFESDMLLLPEGRADKRFFEKLIEAHSDMPKFDMPWPTTEEDRPHLPPGGDHHKYHGRDSFVHMLKSVAENILAGVKTKGILIATDAGDDPAKSFKNVCKQIRDANKTSKAGNFPIPSAPMQTAAGSGRMPSIQIMLLPLSGRGSLETLCVQYLKKHQPKIHAAANAYLTTPPTDISAWNTEKQSKSHFQCMVAGTHEDDPTMSVYGALDRGLIDLQDPMFHPIRDQIKSFAANLASPLRP